MFLQVFNIFHKFRKVRDSTSLIIFGVFLGSFIKAFDSSSIKINFSIDGYIIIVVIFVLVILSTLVTAFIINESKKKDELFGVAFIAFCAFILILFFGRAIRQDVISIDLEKKRLNISEIILLANDNEKKADYNRAIMHLESVEDRLSSDDPRKEVIEERIKKLKLKQVK